MTYPDLAFYALLGACLGYLGAIILMFWGYCAHDSRLRALATLFCGAGFALHTFLAGSQVLLYSFDRLDTGYFLLLFAWVFVLTYFIVRRWRGFSFLSLVVVPLALLMLIVSLQLEEMHGRLPDYLGELFFFLHVGPLFLSLALLTLAFGAALLFLRLEGKIKRKAALSGLEKELPDLNSFDRLNKLAVLLGLPLYTVGLISGFIWVPLVWGKAVTFDPKYIISVIVWLLYAFLFHQRLVKGWRGRKAALLLIGIFAISALSFVGVFPTRHGGMPGPGM